MLHRHCLSPYLIRRPCPERYPEGHTFEVQDKVKALLLREAGAVREGSTAVFPGFCQQVARIICNIRASGCSSSNACNPLYSGTAGWTCPFIRLKDAAIMRYEWRHFTSRRNTPPAARRRREPSSSASN